MNMSVDGDDEKTVVISLFSMVVLGSFRYADEDDRRTSVDWCCGSGM